MQRYLPAIVFLFLLIGAAGYVYDVVNGKQVELRVASEKAARKLKPAEANLSEKQRSMAASKGQVDKINRFIGAWSLHTQEGANPGNVGLAFSTQARSKNLVSGRLPTPLKADYPLSGTQVIVQQIGFSVTGPYPAAVEWLGVVEEEFPFGRVESLELKSQGAGADVQLDIMMSFYVRDRDAKAN